MGSEPLSANASRRGRLSERGAIVLAVALVLAWGGLTWASIRLGWSGVIAPDEIVRGVGATLGLSDPLEGRAQDILVLRLRHALAAGAVGAALALAGALLQGLFRNGLASPSVVGVTAGSVLGACVAIALLGGYGASLVPLERGALTPALVTLFALVGAVVVTWGVVGLASTGRRLSVPTLLLAGIAMNTVVGGILAALQSITLKDHEISRAILAWTFGTLDDRSSFQVGLVWMGLAAAALSIPFVALELDLFAGGEEDAETLGVDVQRVKTLVLLAATVATASSVSVAGQIPFVGLVVPHIVRSLAGSAHRLVLPLSLLLGAVFVLGADTAQRAWAPGSGLRPGVLMSLVGGPFFLVLLVRSRRTLTSW